MPERKRGARPVRENDGFKTIDIAVVDARVNIEVDGIHHNFNPKQALADLKRTYHSFKKGYLTLRVPNSLIKHHLTETADYITDFLNINKEKILIIINSLSPPYWHSQIYIII